jgi:RimJ/RimL family protein N-acetyltransferase
MIRFRKAETKDVDIYFNWANDPEVRQHSYNQESIPYEKHVEWFNRNINDPAHLFLIFFDPDENIPLGQVRFVKDSSKNAIISVSVDQHFRGKGLGTQVISLASVFFHEHDDASSVTAYIKQDNIASLKSFIAAGFVVKENCTYKNIPSVRATKYDQDS